MKKDLIRLGAIFSAMVLASSAAVFAEEEAGFQGDAANGKVKYQQLCSACHGAEGKGDGAAAVALNPKPADHSNKELMGVLTDEYIFNVIKEGGLSVGKSPLMGAWKAVMTDDEIKDVVAFIRTLAN